ncbi:MAG: hypothetical protein GY842_29135 [bacterium]|nr:hypothetical protein [bacterium]
MSNRKLLYREVFRLIQESLCAHGMGKWKQGVFTRGIREGVTGIVGLNTATKYDFHINPIIGVRYEPLERLVVGLEGREFVPYNGDTIARPIGYLSESREYKTWSFEEGEDNAAVVADMVHEIATVGFRYMEDNSTLEQMCERIAVDHHFIMHSDVYQLPVGYLMLGRYDDAERVVRKHLDEIAAHKPPTIEEHEAAQGEKLLPEVIAYLQKTKDQPIPAHEDYRRFAKAFFEKLEAARRGIDPLASLTTD